MGQTVIAIPARLKATRLPDKPLADIAGEPMIVHVWRRAMAAKAGRVIVATDFGNAIAAVIRDAGGEAVMTRPDHPSGSDRIHEAIRSIDPDGAIDRIINLQGDLPTLEPRLIVDCLGPLADGVVDIATLVAEISELSERANPNVVKCVGTPVALADGRPVDGGAVRRLRALYFTRATAPTGEGPLYHHIGIYAYTRAALERFVALKPTPLERRERLEQLRALENGMRVDAVVVETVPLGVDTPEDLEKARAMLAKRF